MRRTFLAVTGMLLAVGIVGAQDTIPNGATRVYSEFLDTGIWEPGLVVNVSAYEDTAGSRYAQYVIQTDGGDHVWCRTEDFSLSVTPRNAFLTFIPEAEESCPDPKLTTVVCRVSDESQLSRSMCNYKVTTENVGQNSHNAAREMWGMDCAVAIGDLSANGLWGTASTASVVYTAAH